MNGNGEKGSMIENREVSKAVHKNNRACVTLGRPKLHSPLRRSGCTDVEMAHRPGKLDEAAGILRRECVSISNNGAGLSASSLLSVTLVLFCVESLAPVS